MTCIFITGSRDATHDMISLACQAVDRAHQKGHIILVGDNTQGVDRAVIDYANKIGATFAVVATKKTLSRMDATGQERAAKPATFREYHHRDRLAAGFADLGMFLWDGRSAGVKAAAEYMASLEGKNVWLYDFSLPPAQRMITLRKDYVERPEEDEQPASRHIPWQQRTRTVMVSLAQEESVDYRAPKKVKPVAKPRPAPDEAGQKKLW